MVTCAFLQIGGVGVSRLLHSFCACVGVGRIVSRLFASVLSCMWSAMLLTAQQLDRRSRRNTCHVQIVDCIGIGTTTAREHVWLGIDTIIEVLRRRQRPVIWSVQWCNLHAEVASSAFLLQIGRASCRRRGCRYV